MNPSTGSALISLIEPGRYPQISSGEWLGQLRNRLMSCVTGIRPRSVDQHAHANAEIASWAKRAQAANGFGDAL